VLFLHNRVQSIDAVAKRLRELFDDRISFDVGHGQMSDDELESVMHRFVKGDVDVLVCTTIIESGLDIPNANTIIIDRADRFGLADPLSTRGRVGRYKHQAYALHSLTAAHEPDPDGAQANQRDQAIQFTR
jgi:transcription-repair coupling factor (superfamily II helicase)